MNAALVDSFVDALSEAEGDDDVSVVLVTGAEAAFCAGADLSERRTSQENQVSEGKQGTSWPAIDAATSFPKPLIGAINGPAYGGGAVLALACDLRFGCTTTKFRFPGTEYGMVVGAAHLPRIVGSSRAKELIFTGRVVEAKEAEDIGLLNRLLPARSLLAETFATASMVAKNSPSAVRAAKETVERATPIEEARLLEDRHNEVLRLMADHRTRMSQAAERLTRGDRK